ncbi:polyamine acetyltransferase SCDLUD_001620 [Saccharomycodes ludwigii]|uniref:polyamine acetyltransferase n=1 Tax=Saccharomycodes ludwigii TaxID=36035 RepID=UPI001E8C0DCD|nr:hypothetical protein SCDLUD_001620 [Saccharomycodes ludwigii]KAH3901837.1 hypothetical protein SCDLUD_001620 [Saccharomycodes ludwigii]
MSSELPLHIYIRPLLLEDIDQIDTLEKQGFPPTERASRDNIIFRLNKGPELCSGLFLRDIVKKKELEDDSIADEDNGEELVVRKETLIGHILATKIPTPLITLESMDLGCFDESSPTIAIHSLVISPEYQKKNLATLLMTDYIQKLSNQEVGENIVIIAHEPLVPFYERLGFKLLGKNQNVNKDPEFTKDGTWCDMTRDLVKDEFEE